MKKILSIIIYIPIVCSSYFCLLDTNSSFSLCVVGVITYYNVDKDKDSVITNNKDKSGIYRWVHTESGKSYVGSSINLSVRLSQYYNHNHISDSKNNMVIYKALLSHGYGAFRLEILEYCTYGELIEREQFYIDTIKPEYNILKVAGSSSGFTHSEATKEVMSQLAKGRTFSTETILKMKKRTVSEKVKSKISSALKGRKVSTETRRLISAAISGRKRSKETLLKMAFNNSKRQPVVLTNINTGISQEFPFMKDAAKQLGTSHTQIRNCSNNNVPYKGYTITLSKTK